MGLTLVVYLGPVGYGGAADGVGTTRSAGSARSAVAGGSEVV